MKLNRRQKDGIADSLEKIGVAAALAFGAGVFLEEKITVINALLLAVIALTSLFFSVIFKGGDND